MDNRGRREGGRYTSGRRPRIGICGAPVITYTSDKNFNQSQENGAKLPWNKTVDLGGGFFTGATVVAQAGQGVDSITCKVSDGDRVISENTSTGQFAVVTCSGS